MIPQLLSKQRTYQIMDGEILLHPSYPMLLLLHQLNLLKVQVHLRNLQCLDRLFLPQDFLMDGL